MYSDKQYTQVKDLTDIPKEVIEKIQLVSLPVTADGTDGQPFGSYMNRVADYFGDIDVIQKFSGCCTKEEVGKKAAKAFIAMVKAINKKENHYFSEFKAGINLPYYFNYGTLVNGNYRISEKMTYVPQVLYKAGLLDDTEMKIISEIIAKPYNERDGNDYDAIVHLFREHYVLRWNEKEVLQGYKEVDVIGGSGRYQLAKALLDKTPVKIDMIIADKNKFIEVTNFFALGLTVKKKFIPINIDPADLTPEALPVEIEKLYYSNEFYKPFKIVKRAFAFLKFIHNNWDKPASQRFSADSKANMVIRGFTKEEISQNLDSYVQVMKSTVNILYTVNSELDAINLVLQRHPKAYKDYKDILNHRLSMLKDSISNVLEIDKKSLDLIMQALDKCIAVGEKRKSECIEILMKTFKEIINFWTIAYFDQLGLNPPPLMVLPPTLAYDPSIIREPWDIPQKPIDLVYTAVERKGGSFFTSIASTLFQKAANAYRRNYCDGKSRPLYKGEYHLGCHNFTGPGTRVDLAEVRDFKPYNAIDTCSRGHDLDYMKAVELPDAERKKAIVDADVKVIKCYDQHPNVSGYWASKNGINSKMKLDKVLPLVAKSIFGKISAAAKPGEKTWVLD